MNNEIILKLLMPESAELVKIEALYERTFPENERRPFRTILDKDSARQAAYAAYDGELLCGFICVLNCDAICHIIYFAVFENLRNRGYGSRILRAVHALRLREKVIVDIERETDTADNNEQRRIRKNFYLRNGYHETEVKYNWRGEDYEILCYNGNVTPGEFENFWKHLEAPKDGSY